MADRCILLSKSIVSDEMLLAAQDALLNERLILGESVYKFEEEFARYAGTKYAVSTNSGTSALFLSLLASGIGRGHEVITTDMSFIATANVALHAGAKPVLCDVNGHGNIDAPKIRKLVRKKTKAIIPVHLHGYPADMDDINALAGRGITVIEDACQAHGAEYRGKRAGSLAEVGCFSFNPMKNMTVCGDGGMVTTNDANVAATVRELADTGRKTPYDCEHTSIGYTARLNTVNAAIGRVQLRHLDAWNEDRRWLAKEYLRMLRDIRGIELPPEEKGKLPAYNKFAIKAKERDGLKDFLWKRGISTDPHFSIPIHLHPAYRRLFGYKRGRFPAAEDYAATNLSLPTYPHMDAEDIAYVCDSIREFFRA